MIQSSSKLLKREGVSIFYRIIWRRTKSVDNKLPANRRFFISILEFEKSLAAIFLKRGADFDVNSMTFYVRVRENLQLKNINTNLKLKTYILWTRASAFQYDFDFEGKLMRWD